MLASMAHKPPAQGSNGPYDLSCPYQPEIKRIPVYFTLLLKTVFTTYIARVNVVDFYVCFSTSVLHFSVLNPRQCAETNFRHDVG